jgi:hypothetical protein
MVPRVVVLLACLVIVLFTAPFVRDAWQWRQIRNYELDSTERAALANWDGSPRSFVVMLHGRCTQLHSTDPQACAQYE